MKTFLTVEYAASYGVTLQKARRFSDEEKATYADWFKEIGFVSLGNDIALDELNMSDIEAVLKRSITDNDGSFSGCNNQVFIITQDQWDALVKLNEEKGDGKSEEEIKECEEIIALYENTKLYTQSEAKVKSMEWKNLQNEGQDGYAPHFYTFQEYEAAKARLDELKR